MKCSISNHDNVGSGLVTVKVGGRLAIVNVVRCFWSAKYCDAWWPGSCAGWWPSSNGRGGVFRASDRSAPTRVPMQNPFEVRVAW